MVAGLLLPDGTAPWAALGAFILLIVFMAGISLNLARGQTPDCQCFGQIYSEPIGSSTLSTRQTIEIGQLLRPFPQFGNVNMSQGTGAHSQYHAAIFQLRKRITG